MEIENRKKRNEGKHDNNNKQGKKPNKQGYIKNKLGFSSPVQNTPLPKKKEKGEKHLDLQASDKEELVRHLVDIVVGCIAAFQLPAALLLQRVEHGEDELRLPHVVVGEGGAQHRPD